VREQITSKEGKEKLEKIIREEKSEKIIREEKSVYVKDAALQAITFTN